VDFLSIWFSHPVAQLRLDFFGSLQAAKLLKAPVKPIRFRLSSDQPTPELSKTQHID
jgi:hypothetical protein